MRTALTMLALTALTSGALAQGRLSTTQMSCQAAASFVQSRGAVIIGFGGERYGRVVRDAGFCNRGEDTKPEFAPTRDNPQCFVGYYCFEYPRSGPR